jgi:dihydroorotase
MPLPDVIAATTVSAAMALKRPELGTLKPGNIGDATILSVHKGEFDYVDVVGEHMVGDKRIFADDVVIAGRWWHPRDRSNFGGLNNVV